MAATLICGGLGEMPAAAQTQSMPTVCCAAATDDALQRQCCAGSLSFRRCFAVSYDISIHLPVCVPFHVSLLSCAAAPPAMASYDRPAGLLGGVGRWRRGRKRGLR